MRLFVVLLAGLAGQAGPAAPVDPAPVGASALAAPEVQLTQFVNEATAGVAAPAMAAPAPPHGMVPPPVPGVASPFSAPVNFRVEERGPFQSDRDFEGFVGPITDVIQAKDPRSLTEARVLFLNNWAKPGTPVLGKGSYQVYALQLRLALTERLTLYADKDGIVRLSPDPGKSVTGLANLMFGAKYALIRDVERQLLFTGAVHYEVPTGYANIYQNQGSGLLAVYGILGKEFGDNWHLLAQFGQNIAVQNQQNSYFYSSVHLDKRIGRLVPLIEFNWFYYNSSAKFLPASIGMEGAGLINLGTAGFSGNSFVNCTPGVKYTLGKNAEFAVAYSFPLTERKMLIGDQLIAELILRY